MLRPVRPALKLLPALLFAAVVGLAWATSVRAADESRFSKSLTADEAAAVHLASLSSDQVAILDALVRRDIAAADFVTKTPRAARFSARLSAGERHNAGLDTLGESQLSQLDTFVQRLEPTAPRGAYAAAARSGGTVTPWVKVNRSPEIHGQVSFMVGAGSHGYSEYGGALLLTYTDPASGLGLAVGYSEIHSKGGYGRCRYGYGDGLDRYSRYDPFGLPGDPWW